uniref:Uncharacterized protein n=1 Tax=Salix viminalis TaxID=40686 RepID=A0A6N2KSI5_SALVM
MVQDIISDGNLKGDRTGTGTLSKFDAIQSAQNFSASYNEGTKYFGEVLLKNSCGSSVVQQVPRSFRKRAFTYGMAMHPEITLTGIIGLKDREEGDLGPVYGFQWRHFGASC